MKTIILTLMLWFLAVNTMGQTADTTEIPELEDTASVSEADTVIIHLKYEDLEIDGVLTDYMHQLNKLN
ncbi:MAG: hypothetical protein VZQ51_00220 [Bacteroidales bacterium]|nr:hypothetical protein [Bacteroidales bacterium]